MTACRVHISPSFDALAGGLWAHIDSRAESKPPVDPFLAPAIFVPNLSCAALLRRHRAMASGVIMNVDFFFLENGLRTLLKRERPWGFVNKDALQHRILSVFLARPEMVHSINAGAEADGRAGAAECPDEVRLFELAAILAENFDNYDLHRHGSAEFQAVLAADPLQSALYRALEAGVHEDNLANDTEKFEEKFFLRELCAGEWEFSDGRREAIAACGLHLFAFTAISPLHLRVLHTLTERAGGELHLWHLAPGAAFRDTEYTLDELPPIRPQDEDIWQKWTRASRSLLCAAAKECGGVVITSPAGASAGAAASPSAGLPSAALCLPPLLRVVGAPGVLREVEFVSNSILRHMRRDASLTADDFTLLMPDPSVYRPYIEMVFSGRSKEPDASRRDPQNSLQNIPYSFIASGGAGASLFLAALKSILNLAADMSNGFARSGMAAVLDNDCVLAAAGTARPDASAWFSWMEKLGVFGGEAFSSELPAHSWARALVRLRLGRVMRLSGAKRWQGVSPWHDEGTGDRASIGNFGILIESLWEELSGVSALRLTGAEWAAKITRLIDRFIAVPAPRALVEGHIPGALTRELAGLSDLPECGFPLIKTLVEAICDRAAPKARFGGRAGVRVAALTDLHFAPAEYIYVLGLNEGAYPQKRQHRDFDLREINLQKYPADIDESDRQRMKFVETLLSARRGIYISYLNKDPIQDSALYPSSLVAELRALAPERKGDMEFSLPLTGWTGPDPAQNTHCPDDVFATHYFLDEVLSEGRTHEDAGMAASRCSPPGDTPAAPERQRGEETSLAGDRLAVSSGVRAAHGVHPPNRFSLHDFARYICNPADGLLSRSLRQERDSLRNILRAPAEPFFPGEAASGVFYEIRNGLLRAWLLSGVSGKGTGETDPDTFAREYCNEEFRASWEERGIIPAGIYAGNYWKRLLAGDDGDTTLLSRIADLPGRIAASGYAVASPFVFGRPPRGICENAMGGLQDALRYPARSDDAPAEISGELPLLWREGDSICCFNYSAVSDGKKGGMRAGAFARMLEYMLAFIPSFVEQFSFPAGGMISVFCPDGSCSSFTLDERHERAFQYAYNALTRCPDSPAADGRVHEDFFLAPIDAVCSCAQNHGRLTREALLLELQDTLEKTYGGGPPLSPFRLSLAPLPSDARLQSWYDEMIAPFLDALIPGEESGADAEENI